MCPPPTHTHTILEVRETELIGQLHAMTQGKMKNLATLEDHLAWQLSPLANYVD